MRIATQTAGLSPIFGDEGALRILAKAGFDGVDLSTFQLANGEGPWSGDDWKEKALRLKELAKACGVAYTQAHAPFPSSRGQQPYDTLIVDRIRRSIQVAATVGAAGIVVHPVHHLPYAKNSRQLYDASVAFYRSLVPVCEEYGILVYAENMWQFDDKRGCIIDSVCSQMEEFNSLLDEIDSPWIKGCLDIGHCALVGLDPADCVRAMGHDRLAALHVHDVDYKRDCHTMPYMERLDWAAVAAALGEIDYTGDLTLEADSFYDGFPKELLPDAAVLMAKTARYLADQVDAHRPR